MVTQKKCRVNEVKHTGTLTILDNKRIEHYDIVVNELKVTNEMTV